MKRKGKQAAYFKCITKNCQASLSLNVKDDVIIEPFNITVENNASLSVQKIYETQLVKERALSDTTFPDFNDVRSNLCKGRNINEVIVKINYLLMEKSF